MSNPAVSNWFGDIVSHPQVIVDAHSVDDIVRVLRDPVTYPAPVRAVGSNHSTSACGTADGGTVLRIRMNRILAIGADFITVEAGATHLQMAKALQSRNLQFYINTEIGSLTAGSAACCGTKDASFPGEFGQVGSYITAMKLVLPSGELFAIGPDQPELLQLFKSSYGLLGIVYEVTYRVRPLTPMAVHHETYSIADFADRLGEITARDASIMYYFFPFADKITVEFRRHNPTATGLPNHIAWPLRNYIWGTAGPRFAHDIGATVANPAVRYDIIDGFGEIFRFKLEHLVSSDHTLPPDQIIDYPPVSDDSRYTFSLYAFPEAQFATIFSDFCAFVKDYHARHGYRSDLLYVGYRIAQDQASLLSYSWDGPVMTIDPVSTGGAGWSKFLDAYNIFCSDRGGSPALNQTPGLTPVMVDAAFGDRLKTLVDARKTYDPSDRLLNPYFRTLLSIGA